MKNNGTTLHPEQGNLFLNGYLHMKDVKIFLEINDRNI